MIMDRDTLDVKRNVIRSIGVFLQHFFRNFITRLFEMIQRASKERVERF